MIFEVYTSEKDTDYRWRIKARNGRIVADGSDGYRNKKDCLKMVMAIVNRTEPFSVTDLTVLRLRTAASTPAGTTPKRKKK